MGLLFQIISLYQSSLHLVGTNKILKIRIDTIRTNKGNTFRALIKKTTPKLMIKMIRKQIKITNTKTLFYKKNIQQLQELSHFRIQSSCGKSRKNREINLEIAIREDK